MLLTCQSRLLERMGFLEVPKVGFWVQRQVWRLAQGTEQA